MRQKNNYTKYIFNAGLLMLLLVVVACEREPQSIQNVNSAGCSSEVVVCPDGTRIQRQGENCEFPSCPEINREDLSSYKLIDASSISGADEAYKFSAMIPNDWDIRAVSASDSLYVYDSKVEGATIENAQIFIRYFKADDFLTLKTVTIHSRTEVLINGLPSVRYEIEKIKSVPNFVNQPSWRNKRHIVTDIKINSSSPATYLVVAKNPELSETVYQSFLNSIRPNDINSVAVAPVNEFENRITKKKFGTFVTPENSPVSPERFRGYHTGVDVEFTDTVEEVFVNAIADGEVIYSTTASGYGGVIAILHKIENQDYVAVYGHLKPSSLVAANTQVAAGQKIGVLGDDRSVDTDGERKHLHLSITKGNTLNLKGYVQTEEELKNWIDPLEIIK